MEGLEENIIEWVGYVFMEIGACEGVIRYYEKTLWFYSGLTLTYIQINTQIEKGLGFGMW